MAEIPKSVVDQAVFTFVSQYGPEQLIEWLGEFDYMGGPEKFRKYKKLEKIACREFNITLADMHNPKSTNATTDTKRVISFVAFNGINLSQPIIARLMGNVSIRSVGYYIKDAEEWILNPKTNKTFVDHYNTILAKYNIEQVQI